MLGMRAEYCAPEMAPYIYFPLWRIFNSEIPDRTRYIFPAYNNVEAEELQCLFQGMLYGFLL